MGERKIIQLLEACDRINALCDDGTAWQIDARSCEWVQLPPIPQPVEAE